MGTGWVEEIILFIHPVYFNPSGNRTPTIKVTIANLQPV
jgi:hypothetical protein